MARPMVMYQNNHPHIWTGVYADIAVSRTIFFVIFHEAEQIMNGTNFSNIRWKHLFFVLILFLCFCFKTFMYDLKKTLNSSKDYFLKIKIVRFSKVFYLIVMNLVNMCPVYFFYFKFSIILFCLLINTTSFLIVLSLLFTNSI